MQATHADPYAGITLPEPPTGYRLAKWQEKYDERAMWWSGGAWKGFGNGSVFRVNDWAGVGDPKWSIFAIPFDQSSSLKSWQFREAPWVQPEPKTLADCPSLTNVIVEDENGLWVVACKLGFDGQQLGGRELGPAKNLKFIQYLDPPPQKPLSLNDVPDGRVIECRGHHYWKAGGNWFRRLQNGEINQSIPTDKFTITNYIAEFRGPAWPT